MTTSPAYRSISTCTPNLLLSSQRGPEVSRAESCWVSMCWKAKHITFDPTLSSPHPDQEPHSSAFAGSHLWRAKSVPITDFFLVGGGVGVSPIETNIMLLAHVWEWFNTGEWEAAGLRVILNLTLHIPEGGDKREVIPESVALKLLVFVCGHLKYHT